MSELRMPRIEGQLEITGGPTILHKKHDCDLQINKTLRTNKLEQESQKKREKI